MKYSIAALALLYPFLTGAQPAARPLSVGDAVGEEDLLNYNDSKVRLSQVKAFRRLVMVFSHVNSDPYP